MDGEANQSEREKTEEKTTKMTKIRPKRYIVWSTNKEIDLSDPWQRKWYIGEVLSNGRAEDIAELDWDEVRKILPELNLPKRVRRLWEDYFQHA